ncbi:MAG: recombinase family protein [Alphaproteobacteria bacterium]|nr:recombinase family protein [Alphaproteobacteria bacterium]
MTVYAYLRVSTEEQDYESQRYGILRYCAYRGITIDKEYVDEGVSGTVDFHFRKLGKLVKILQAEDLIIVSELSRLSRSMIDMYALTKIFADRGVRVFCIKENLELGNTAIGLMIMTVFAFSAQIERERISQRTKEALDRKRSDGVKLGRPKGRKSDKTKLSGKETKIAGLLAQNLSVNQIARVLKCAPITLTRFLKRRANHIVLDRVKFHLRATSSINYENTPIASSDLLKPAIDIGNMVWVIPKRLQSNREQTCLETYTYKQVVGRISAEIKKEPRPEDRIESMDFFTRSL